MELNPGRNVNNSAILDQQSGTHGTMETNTGANRNAPRQIEHRLEQRGTNDEFRESSTPHVSQQPLLDNVLANVVGLGNRESDFSLQISNSRELNIRQPTDDFSLFLSENRNQVFASNSLPIFDGTSSPEQSFTNMVKHTPAQPVHARNTEMLSSAPINGNPNMELQNDRLSVQFLKEQVDRYAIALEEMKIERAQNAQRMENMERLLAQRGINLSQPVHTNSGEPSRQDHSVQVDDLIQLGQQQTSQVPTHIPSNLPYHNIPNINTWATYNPSLMPFRVEYNISKEIKECNIVFNEHMWKTPLRFLERFENVIASHALSDQQKINLLNNCIKYRRNEWLRKVDYETSYGAVRNKFIDTYWDERTQHLVTDQFFKQKYDEKIRPKDLVTELQNWYHVIKHLDSMKNDENKIKKGIVGRVPPSYRTFIASTSINEMWRKLDELATMCQPPIEDRRAYENDPWIRNQRDYRTEYTPQRHNSRNEEKRPQFNGNKRRQYRPSSKKNYSDNNNNKSNKLSHDSQAVKKDDARKADVPPAVEKPKTNHLN